MPHDVPRQDRRTRVGPTGLNRLLEPRVLHLTLVAPATLFLILFCIVPFLQVFGTSLIAADGGFTLGRFSDALQDSFVWSALLRTFRISLYVTLLTLLFGYPLAYILTNVVKTRSARRLIYLVIIAPLFTSNIVRAFGWIIILGRRGVVNDALVASGLIAQPLPLLYSETAMVISLFYIMLPFMVLSVASVLQTIDASLQEAARDLGASKTSAFAKIVVPLSAPGLIAGSAIVFTLSVSAYVSPSILSGGKHFVMSMLIFQQYSTLMDYAMGATLAVILLVSTLVLMAGYLAVVERPVPR